MRQTVLGVFESYTDARSAQQTLGEAGVAQADIAIYSMSTDAPVEKGPRVYAPGSADVRHHNPVFDQLEQLFARLFKRGQYPAETEDYRELIRRGGAIISADVSEMQVVLARDLMHRAGASDIEERAREWRNSSTEAGLPEESLHRGSATSRDYSGQHVSSSAQPGHAMSSSIGANMVGGMEQVTTRTQQPGSTASLENRQKLTGGSDADFTRTNEGVRTNADSHATYATGSGTIGSEPEPASRTGLVGDPITGTPLDDGLFDDEFRADYDAHYADTGESYDEYQRAYQHGATLGQDEQFRGHDWQRVEANARENWESQYPESGWERFKAAVRHGWDRVTGG